MDIILDKKLIQIWVTQNDSVGEQIACVAIKRSSYKHRYRFLTVHLLPRTSAHSRVFSGQENADTSGQVICKVVLCLPFMFLCSCRIVLWVRYARILFSSAINSMRSLPLSSFSVFIKMFSVPTMDACNTRYGFHCPMESPVSLLKM